MNQQSGNPEPDSLSNKLEAVKFFVQHIIDVARQLPETEEYRELLGNLQQLAEIDFDRLGDEARQLVEQSASSAGIEKFRQEIEARERTIHEFKLSLADSVIELKNAQKSAQAANEKTAALNSQVTQMQLHTKELGLRLSSASSALEKREKELETAQKELDDLRGRLYQLKSQNAEYEDHMRKAAEQLKQAADEQKMALSVRDKAERDLQHVLTSNRELKSSLEILEIRERELVESIDVLQKERNHLQTRLNTLLTGFGRTVSYAQPSSAFTQGSVLEPSVLTPYLPFCFPERLPAAIKFRRQISMSFPADYSRRAHKNAPVFLSLNRPAFPNAEAVRSQKRLPKIKACPKSDLALSVYRFTPATVFMPFTTGYKLDNMAGIKVEFAPTPPERIVYLKQIWWQKTAKPAAMSMKSARTRGFHIIGHSFDLYLQFLVSTIVSQNSHPSETRLQHAWNDKKRMHDIEQLNHAINFQETLAYRHRLQLKSTRLEMPGATLLQSFKRGNKLKSVLEMFGNTISSMVNRFESIPNSRSGNGENK